MNRFAAILIIFFGLHIDGVSQVLCDSSYSAYLYEKQLFTLLIKSEFNSCEEQQFKQLFIKSAFRLKQWDKMAEPKSDDWQQLFSQDIYFNYVYQYVQYSVLGNTFSIYSDSQITNWIKQTNTQNPTSSNEIIKRILNVELYTRYRNSNSSITKIHTNYLKELKPILFTEFNELLEMETEATSKQQKKVSPYVSASLSALIPGAGRLVYGEWLDAFQSAFMTVGSGYLTYKHRHQKPYNWIFASFTGVFYVSNITGTFQSAIRYNSLKKNKLRDRVELLFINLPVIYQ